MGGTLALLHLLLSSRWVPTLTLLKICLLKRSIGIKNGIARIKNYRTPKEAYESSKEEKNTQRSQAKRRRKEKEELNQDSAELEKKRPNAMSMRAVLGRVLPQFSPASREPLGSMWFGLDCVQTVFRPSCAAIVSFS